MRKYIKIGTSIIISSIIFGGFIIVENDINEINQINNNEAFYNSNTRGQRVYKDIDLNSSDPDSLSENGESEFNSKNDKSKYGKVTDLPGGLKGSSFGNGREYELEFDLVDILNLQNNSRISQVTFDSNDRFDFYRTIQLTDDDFWSGNDYNTSGRFWSSEGLNDEDTWGGINKQRKGYNYTHWDEMSDGQKRNQAPYIGTINESTKEANTIVIHSGETKQLVKINNGPDEGIPREYYNKNDFRNKDGWINEIGLIINAKLDFDSILTFSIKFTNNTKSLDGNRSKNFSMHLPLIDAVELDDYVDGNAIANQNKEYNIKNDNVELNDEYIISDKPDSVNNIQFSNDAKKIETRKYFDNYGGLIDTTKICYDPVIETTYYDSESGILHNGWERRPSGNEGIGIPYNHMEQSFSYKGTISYESTYTVSTGKYDFANLFNDYSEEQLKNDLLNNLSHYNSKSIIRGLSSDKTTYQDLEVALRGENNIKQIPLSSGTDISFYDVKNDKEINDKTQYIESDKLKLKFSGNGTNENIVGESKWVEIEIPYIYNVVIENNDAISETGYNSFNFINENGLNSNDNLKVLYESNNVILSNSKKTNEQKKQYVINTSFNEKIITHQEERVEIFFNNIKYNESKIIFDNGSIANKIINNFNEFVIILDEDGNKFIPKKEDFGIYKTNDGNLNYYVKAGYDEKLHFKYINDNFIDNEIIYMNEYQNKLYFEPINNKAIEFDLFSSKEAAKNHIKNYFTTDFFNNQWEAMLERGYVTNEDVNFFKENYDAIWWENDFEYFNQMTNVNDLVNDEYFNKYMKSQILLYSIEYGFIIGESTVRDLDNILTFAAIDGILPLGKNPDGSVINQYEWLIEVSKVNGEHLIPGFENIVINEGDLLEISITHKQTIDPNAKYYGSGFINIKVGL